MLHIPDCRCVIFFALKTAKKSISRTFSHLRLNLISQFIDRLSKIFILDSLMHDCEVVIILVLEEHERWLIIVLLAFCRHLRMTGLQEW